MSNLIIDQPNWQSAKQRVVFGSLTVLFWAIWIYIWLPILALVGWALGLRIAYVQMVEMNGYLGLVHLLWTYTLVVFALGGALLLWAYYNYFRFRDGGTRKLRPAVADSDLIIRYGLVPEQFAQWLGARRLVMHHSFEGNLLSVDL